MAKTLAAATQSQQKMSAVIVQSSEMFKKMSQYFSAKHQQDLERLQDELLEMTKGSSLVN